MHESMHRLEKGKNGEGSDRPGETVGIARRKGWLAFVSADVLEPMLKLPCLMMEAMVRTS